MKPETSPFRPGQPGPPGFFIGRSAEIEQLRAMIRRSTVGAGFVTGKQGVGKRSLAAFVRCLVEQDSNTVGCHVYLEGVINTPEMLRRVFYRLLNESIDKPWHQRLISFLGNRAPGVRLYSVALDPT